MPQTGVFAQVLEGSTPIFAVAVSGKEKEGELGEKLVCKDFLQNTPHGAIKEKMQSRAVKFYNLDVIISGGYRVKSQRGTQFRQWATIRHPRKATGAETAGNLSTAAF